MFGLHKTIREAVYSTGLFLAICSQTTIDSAFLAPNQGFVVVHMYCTYYCGP